MTFTAALDDVCTLTAEHDDVLILTAGNEDVLASTADQQHAREGATFIMTLEGGGPHDSEPHPREGGVHMILSRKMTNRH